MLDDEHGGGIMNRQSQVQVSLMCSALCQLGRSDRAHHCDTSLTRWDDQRRANQGDGRCGKGADDQQHKGAVACGSKWGLSADVINAFDATGITVHME